MPEDKPGREPDSHLIYACRVKLSPAKSAIYLITGPMAAGKSTVARLLAERFERGVYLEGDFFRRSVVSGRAEMTPDPSPEAVAQLQLRYRLAVAAADTYCQAGFTVALEDVIAGLSLGAYRTTIRSRPCHVIVLMPSRETIAAREAARPTKGYTRWIIEQLYQAFSTDTAHVGLWLDTSHQTADETVDEILAQTLSARSPVVISDYDDEWPILFRQIAAPIEQALGDVAIGVEHVGSTAVPGLAAKPVIDIDIVVAEAADVPVAIEQIRRLGYVYQGDKGIAGREAFMRPPHLPPHHLYVVIAGNKPHTDHIRFRDYLRAHPDVAREYADLKKRLADEHRDQRERYTDAKTEFIARALAAAQV